MKQYQKMFQLDGVELVFDEEALDTIADQALERGTGARGLRAIMEEVLLPVMFDLPSRDDIATVVITARRGLQQGRAHDDRPRRQAPQVRLIRNKQAAPVAVTFDVPGHRAAMRTFPRRLPKEITCV